VIPIWFLAALVIGAVAAWLIRRSRRKTFTPEPEKPRKDDLYPLKWPELADWDDGRVWQAVAPFRKTPPTGSSRRTRTMPPSATNCKPISTSLCNCRGRSIATSTRRDIGIAASANRTARLAEAVGCGKSVAAEPMGRLHENYSAHGVSAVLGGARGLKRRLLAPHGSATRCRTILGS